MEEKSLMSMKYAELRHGIFDIWNEDNVVRNALGQFTKKTGEAVSKVASNVASTASNAATAVGEGVGSAVKEVTTAADAIFKLAGGLPDWVYAQLFYALNNGQLSEADIMAAFNSMGKNPSMQQKISIIDGLIKKREKQIDTDGFESLDQIPKKPIKSLEETLAEDHFEYVDWENPDKRVGNCPLSTFAYELQRRGYDVEAMDLENGTDMEIFSWDGYRTTAEALEETFSKIPSTYDMYNASPLDSKAFGSGGDLTRYIKDNPNEFPAGSRGFLEMQGHIQNYEVNSQGKVVWIDGQVGGYRGQGNLGQQTLPDQAYANPPLKIMRTDDKEINEMYLSAMRQQDDTVAALSYMKSQLEKEKYEIANDQKPMVKDYYVDLVEEELKKLK